MSDPTASESPAYGVGDTSFKAAGGTPGLMKLVDDFYRFMDELPEAAGIRAMHPDDLEMARDKLARFLCGWLGGPKRYNEKYGEIHIPGAHAHFRIGGDERDAWLVCMQKAIALQPYDEGFRAYLLRELRVPAGRIFDTSKDPL
jgi:hemoglobin